MRILDYNLLLDQWDQVLVEFMSRNLGHLEELLVRDDWIFVEEEQEEHLVGGAEEFVPLAFFESASNLCVAQGQLPV